MKDTGPGINSEDYDSSFEPFSQTEIGQISQEDTGLGLPISRQFVQLMGGDLTDSRAIELWQQWAPDLIWMDTRMPVMDGFEATWQIRALSASLDAAPKILALTASTFEDERAAIVATGCDDFVYKPAMESTLFEKIAEHLRVRYLYEEPPILEPELSDLNDAVALSREQLAEVLPRMLPDWIDQLQQSARIADEEWMIQLLEQFPDYARLAAALRVLVSEFQLERLIELTIGARHNSKSA